MRTAWWLALTAVTAMACRDSDTGPRNSSEILANVIPCDQQFIPEPGCTDPGPPVGGGINPSDSYAVATVVQSQTTTVSDDVTGEVTVMTAPEIGFQLEVGYSPATGLDVYQHVLSPREGGDESLRVIRVEGNVASEIGHDGLPAEPAPSDLDGSLANPLIGMPDLGMFPSIIDAIVGGGAGFLRLGELAGKLDSINASVVEVASGTSLRKMDDSHIVLSMRPQRDEQSEVLFSRTPRGEWVLRQIDNLSEVSSTGKRIRLASRMRLKGIRHTKNIPADRLRDARRAKRFGELRDATATIGASFARQPVSLSLPPGTDSWSRTGIINWHPPTPLTFPITPPPTPGQNVQPERTAEEDAGCVDAAYAAAQQIPISSGPKIAFQHGFISGACTWQFQLPFFTTDASGGRIVGNTSWPLTYETQASQLRNQIPAGTAGWILVGHSNGGVISRYLAQTSAPGFAKAVITINSPHAGADLPARTASFLQGTSFIYTVGQAIWASRGMGWRNLAPLYSNVSVVGQLLRGDAVVLQQMQPGSQFLSDLNGRSEAAFRKYAIRSQVDDQWMSVRVYCDTKAASSPGVPAGRACVKDAKRMVERAAFNAGFFRVLSIIVQSIPLAGPIVSSGLQYASRAFLTLTGLMYAVDWKWREAFCDNQACDGVVRMNSQLYPSADAERVIPSADSHVGSTKSMRVQQSLRGLMNLALQP
jgi:pimeloyl-ACP methyl ester carboxylesterase